MNELAPTKTREVFQDELTPGEILIWCGQPSTSVIFHPSDWFAVPFTLMWGGFAIFWEIGASGGTEQIKTPNGGHIDIMSVWGIPFVVIGQYMIWGLFFYIAWKKRRTFYALTDKRVIVVSLGIGRKVIDGYLHALPSVELSERPDKIGTIDFGQRPSSQSFWGSLGSKKRGQPQLDIDLASLTFHDLVDARSIYQLIQSQRERAN